MCLGGGVPWPVRAGLLAGMGVGGALTGKWCARSCEALNPKHAMVFGVSNALIIFLFREFAEYRIGNNFTETPWWWQMVFIIPISTLTTVAIANKMGVSLMASTATKIVLGTIAGAIAGAFVFGVVATIVEGSLAKKDRK